MHHSNADRLLGVFLILIQPQIVALPRKNQLLFVCDVAHNRFLCEFPSKHKSRNHPQLETKNDCSLIDLREVIVTFLTFYLFKH